MAKHYLVLLGIVNFFVGIAFAVALTVYGLSFAIEGFKFLMAGSVTMLVATLFFWLTFPALFSEFSFFAFSVRFLGCCSVVAALVNFFVKQPSVLGFVLTIISAVLSLLVLGLSNGMLWKLKMRIPAILGLVVLVISVFNQWNTYVLRDQWSIAIWTQNLGWLTFLGWMTWLSVILLGKNRQKINAGSHF